MNSLSPQNEAPRYGLAWLPIPILLVTMVVFRAGDFRTEFDSPVLLMVVNFFTRTLACLLIVILAGWSFLASKKPGLLLLGCGVAIWGTSGFITTAILTRESNLGVTISNLGVWLAALCHLAGVVLSLRSKRTVRRAALWLGAGYTLAVGAVGLIVLGTFAGWLPVFFVEGQGGMPVRHIVLGAALVMFALTAVLLWEGNRPSLSPFARWYLLALLLIGVGIFGMILQSSRNSLLNWACRSTQYFSGIYMLIAAFGARGESGGREIELGQAQGEPRYRYGVAIAIVLAAAAVRLAFFQVLGTRVLFVTFYPAVMLAALYGGFRAGLLAAFLSALVVDYFWTGQVGFDLPGSVDWVAMAIFLVSCVMISAITEAMHRAQAQAVAVQAEARVAAERQRAAELLRQKDTELKQAQRLARIGSWYWDAKTDVTTGSDELLRIYGFDPASEAMPNFKDQRGRCYSVEDWERVNAAVQMTLATGTGYELDVQVIRNGVPIWVTTRGELVRDAAGQAAGLRGTVQDIAERKRAEEALRETEQRFRLALKNAPVSVALQDRNLVYQWAYNQRTRRPDEIVGKTDADLFAPEDVPGILEVKRGVIESGTEAHVQHWLTSNGKRLFLDLYYEPTRDGAGEITGLGIAVVDLTKQKLAEEALQESERRERERAEELAILFEAVPIPVFIARDPDCLHLAGNRLADEILRIPHGNELSMSGPVETKPHHFRALKDGRELRLEELPAQRAARGACVRDFEFTLAFDDGMVRQVLGYGTPLLDEQGRPRGTVAVLVDITERKQAENALREANLQVQRRAAEMQALMNAVPAAIFIAHDAECRQMSGSHFTQELLGLAPTANVSKSAPPEQRPSHFRAMKDGSEIPPAQLPVQMAARGAVARDYEFDLALEDGTVRTLIGNAVPLLDEGGHPRGAIGAFIDITRRKRAEECIQASLREKEVLLKEIHHRVKNNLQVIASLVDLQTDALTEPGLRPVFADMRDRVRSIALVHEKLYQSESLARVEFAEYARSLLGSLWRTHSSSATTVGLKLDLEPVSLSIVSAIPCGLLLNELVINALKHAFRGRSEGEVTVELRSGPEGRVSLSVRDNGVGMPASLDWRRSSSLGLRLVQLLVEQLDGALEVRVGAGTEFWVSFLQPKTEPSQGG